MAQKFADCRCIGGSSKANNLARPFSRWATKWEYWHAGESYHLICASLILDGAPIGRVP
jgi:hypothetical protein